MKRRTLKQCIARIGRRRKIPYRDNWRLHAYEEELVLGHILDMGGSASAVEMMRDRPRRYDRDYLVKVMERMPTLKPQGHALRSAWKAGRVYAVVEEVRIREEAKRSA